MRMIRDLASLLSVSSFVVVALALAGVLGGSI